MGSTMISRRTKQQWRSRPDERCSGRSPTQWTDDLVDIPGLNDDEGDDDNDDNG